MDDDELLDLLTSIEEPLPTRDKPERFERDASKLDRGLRLTPAGWLAPAVSGSAAGPRRAAPGLTSRVFR